jgi:hypothetical protein
MNSSYYEAKVKVQRVPVGKGILIYNYEDLDPLGVIENHLLKMFSGSYFFFSSCSLG